MLFWTLLFFHSMFREHFAKSLKILRGSIVQLRRQTFGEFPGSPVVRTQHFHCWSLGLISGRAGN